MDWVIVWSIVAVSLTVAFGLAIKRWMSREGGSMMAEQERDEEMGQIEYENSIEPMENESQNSFTGSSDCRCEKSTR